MLSEQFSSSLAKIEMNQARILCIIFFKNTLGQWSFLVPLIGGR